MNGKTLLLIAAVAGGVWFMKRKPATHDLKLKAVSDLRNVKVYSFPQAESAVQRIGTMLDLRGIPYTIVPLVIGDANYKRMEGQGLAKGGQLELPLEINGRFVRFNEAPDVLRPLPFTKRSLFDAKGVIVYAPANCPTTDAVIAKLSRHNIPFTRLDVNGSARAEFEAKTAHQPGGLSRFPVLDVKGKLMSVSASDNIEKVASLAR